MIRTHKSISPKFQEECVLKCFFHLRPLIPQYNYHDYCCFSPDGQIFAIISDSEMITLFNCNGIELTSITNKKYRCSRLLFHPNKKALYLNSKNESQHAARMLDINTKSFIRYFDGINSQITSMVTLPNGLITSSVDGIIQFWDDQQNKPTFEIKSDPYSNIAIHPNGRCICIASPFNLSFYDIRNLQDPISMNKIFCYNDELVPYFSPLGNKLMLIGEGFLQQYILHDSNINIRSNNPDVNLKVQSQKIPGFAYTQDENFFLIPNQDSDILVLDSNFDRQYKDQKAITPVEANLITVLSGTVDDPISCISFSSKFHNFVSTSKECLLWTVDTDSYRIFMDQYEK